MNAGTAKHSEYLSNLRPFFAEDFSLIFLPLSKNVFAEVRTSIEESVCKIKKEWLANNSHLDRAEFLIDHQQLRHIETKNSRNMFFTEPLIDTAFTLEWAILAMKLSREKSWFFIVYRGKNSTMDTKT